MLLGQREDPYPVMREKKITAAAVILILLVLFLPVPHRRYKDGGTRDFKSLTYRLVIWNRFVEETGGEMGIYHKTSVYWFPCSLKSIDELWETEKEKTHK